MTRIKSLFGVTMLCWLVACGQSNQTEHQTQQERSIDESVIGAPLNRALERSSQVEGVIQGQAEQLRRSIEEAEGR